MSEENKQNANDREPKKVSRLRKTIGTHMKESWLTSPVVTYTRPVDASGIREFRNEWKGPFAEKGAKLTYNHIIMKAVGQVLIEMPDVNSSFDENTGMQTEHVHANVGLAVARSDGLIVPNVKSVDELSLYELSVQTEDVIRRTRENKIQLDDITGGTFTVSNLGSYGITSFSPIINPPQLAILGVCAMSDTPVVRDGQITVRPIMNMSLTADHRIIDGAAAAAFLQRLAEVLEALPETGWKIE